MLVDALFAADCVASLFLQSYTFADTATSEDYSRRKQQFISENDRDVHKDVTSGLTIAEFKPKVCALPVSCASLYGAP